MKILAIDTSAVTASCAVCEDGRLVAASELRSKMTHSQTVLPMVHDMLKNSALTLKGIDTLAVNVGPGSFTGVRIGVAAVKGMAFTDKKPCVAVSSLESMAYNFAGLPLDGIVCAVMDARCGQVYAALFRIEGETVHRLSPDAAISIENLKKMLISEKKSVFFVGDGANLCYTSLRSELPSSVLAPDRLRFQHAAGTAACAFVKAQAGELTDAAQLRPVYLRLPQAERELRAKQKAGT